MDRKTLAPDGRKRERSGNTGSIRYSYPNTLKGLFAPSPHSAFTIWRDEDLVKELHPPKRIRKSFGEYRSLTERDMNKNTSVSPVGQGQTPKSTKVPSLKSKIINRNGKNFNHESRASRAMDLSSPLKIVSRPHSSALAPRQYAVAHDTAIPFPSLLRSPFKPAKRRSIHKKVAQAATDTMFRRPSDGLATRRARLLDSRRHPSDSSASKRQNIHNPFLKELGPFPQPRRQTSFFDDLQKPTPATPKTPSLYKSPSINAGFSGPIPEPIPHVPALLDTPSNDTDQLIADMSEFSLAPKPCSLQLTPPSIVPVLEDGPVSMQIRDSTPVGTTQSSPGISIPSIDDSWFVAKQGPHSTPVKGPLSSDDELNLFLPIHSPTLAVSRRRSLKPVNGSVQRRTQFQSLKRTYGKKTSRKSVAFAPNLTGSTNVIHHPAYNKHAERRSSDERMDISDDELLLK